MKESIAEITKYAQRREPTNDELIADMRAAELRGSKTEAAASAVLVKINGVEYRYHPGVWHRFAGYTLKPSIWHVIGV